MKTFLKVILGFLAVVFIGMILLISFAKEPDASIPWHQKTTEERATFLENYLASNNDESALEMENIMDAELKKQVSFPKTVKYQVYPVLSNFKILSEDSGLVHMRGSLTCSNAFNVPIEYQYYLLVKRTDSIHSLLKATVY